MISDVHLAEAEHGEREDGAWMRWRRPDWFPDHEFRRFADHLRAIVPAGDEAEIVFGGDIFEFEGPRVIDGETRFDDPPRTESDAVETLGRILRDHPIFVGAVADLVRHGFRAVFVSGNHDVQLVFPRVRAALREAIAAHLPELDAATLDDRLQAHPWFYQTEDGLHFEHGHQYDAFCSFRDPLQPLAHDADEIPPTVGSVAFRRLVSRMGYFNAYDERSFMLSGPAYLRHWARHYLFSRRSLAATWMIGTFQTIGTMLLRRPGDRLLQELRARAARSRARFAAERGLDREKLDAHAALFAQPVEHEPQRMIRELRGDHGLCAVAGLAGVAVAAFRPKLGLAIALASVVAAALNELAHPARGLVDEYARIGKVRRAIASLYGARAVVFGHTHIPDASIDDGVLYANTGSWASQAPSADDPEPEDTSYERGRPVVWIRRLADDRDAPIAGGLHRFRGDTLTPEVVRPTALPPEPAPTHAPAAA